jgi:hypothetical protein
VQLANPVDGASVDRKLEGFEKALLIHEEALERAKLVPLLMGLPEWYIELMKERSQFVW